MVQADEIFKSFAAERFETYFSTNYYKTQANYSSQGTQTSLPSGNSFNILDINMKGRYVPAADFGIYGALNIGSSESADSLATRRNSTLNNITFGVDDLFYKGDLISSYLDLSFGHSLDKYKADSDSVMNNDGAEEFKAKVTTIFDLDAIYPFAQGGLNYRTEGLSTLLTYAGGIEVRFIQATVGAGLYGYLTLKEDSKTNTAYERDTFTNRVNAGSKTFNGVNPNNLDSDFYVKFEFGPDINLKVNAGTSIMGSNSASGSHIGGTLAWAFGGLQRNYSRPARRATPVKEKVANPTPHFQEDTDDGVNQDYFKTVKPSKDNYIQQVDEGGKPVKVAPVKPSPPESEKDYKIKLKKLKKKKKKKVMSEPAN